MIERLTVNPESGDLLASTYYYRAMLTVYRTCFSPTLGEKFSLSERMFGTGAKFDYTNCYKCKTVQIVDIPVDLGLYYPSGYYSFGRKKDTFKARLKAIFKPEPLPEWLLGTRKSASVLDVGCGEGALLRKMKDWGFKALSGFDPYSASYTSRPGGRYDLVMMHHTLEHVSDPKASLFEARQWLTPGGRIVIRIPVRQGPIWEQFGWNWVHLDPPRHLYAWTVLGFKSMAEECGLHVVDSGFDTTLFSIAGSELVERGVPTEKLLLTPERCAILNSQAAAMNAAGDGDCAWFMLKTQTAS